MKKLINLCITLSLVLLLAGITTPALAQTADPPPPIEDDRVVVGQTFVLKEGQTLEGDLVVIGGTAILKPDSLVEGEIVLIGGVLEAYGIIEGDIQAMGGSLELMETAIITGSLYNYGSTITQMEGAIIEGQQFANLPFELDIDALPFVESAPVPGVTVHEVGGFIGDFLWAIIQILAIAALAILIVLLAPKPSERMAKSIGKQPFVHWGIGLLTIFAAPVVLVVMMITIILIPVSLLGFMALAIATLYGWIVLGYEIGRRLFKNSSATLSPAIIAGLGTLILTVIARLAAIVPCVGWTVGAVLSLFGLGAIVLTRFGTRDYPPTAPVGSVPPVAPTPVPQPNLPEPLAEPSLEDILGDDELLDADFDEELEDLDELAPLDTPDLDEAGTIDATDETSESDKKDNEA